LKLNESEPQKAETKQRVFRQAYDEARAVRNIIIRNLGRQLYPYQLMLSNRIIGSVVAGGLHEIPICWARQSGKTEILVETTIALCIYVPRYLGRRFNVGIFAPSRTEQTIVVTRDRIREFAGTLKPWLAFACGTKTVLDAGLRTADYIFQDSNGCMGTIRCMSTQPKANVKAHTEQLQLFEQVEDMDEQKILTDIFPFGAGSETGCTRVFAGTPSLEIHNHYYYDKLMELEERGPPSFVDYELAGMYKPGYREFVEAEKAILGEDSDAFRTQYKLEWILPRNKLIDRDTLLTLNWFPETFTPNPKNLRAAGTDVAKQVDSTVVTVGERLGATAHILGWLELEGTDYEVQVDEIAKFLEAWKVQVNEVDSTGVGDPVLDMLTRRLKGICSVRGQRFTPQENDRLYKQYERELIHRRILLPSDETCKERGFIREKRRFIEQHVDAEKVYSKNLLQIEKPNRPNAHTDYVASGALMVDALIESPFHDLPVLTRSR